MEIDQVLKSTAIVEPEVKQEPLTEKSKIPLPLVGQSPLRFAINGVVDKIADLKKFVAEQKFDPDLKAYIDSELDELTSNAAEIHLHDVEQPGGGFDLHLSIRPRHLGGHAQAVFVRTETENREVE